MSLIDEIKDDLEVCTPGPYRKTLDHEWSLDTGGGNAYFVIAGPTGPFAIVAVEDAWAFDDTNEADQRRVCRLDRMEAALLAAEELAGKAEAAWMRMGQTEAAAQLGEAIHSFREACK